MKNRLIKVFVQQGSYIVYCKKLNLSGYGSTVGQAFEMFFFTLRLYLKR